MTRELQTISADASWEEAVALMERIHVRHLPVMDRDRVVGLVTARNLIGWRTEHLNGAVDERTHELQRLAEQLLLRDRQSQRDMTVAGRLLNRLLLPKRRPCGRSGAGRFIFGRSIRSAETITTFRCRTTTIWGF